MPSHGIRIFLILAAFALQLSQPFRVNIKFTGSTYTERGRLVGSNTMTQSCNNALLMDCCVALRDMLWMHRHPVNEIFYALYLEFVPSRIEITGLPDATSIGAAWVNEDNNDDPEKKGCEGRIWEYGVGPGDWQVDTFDNKALEAKWFDSVDGINKQSLGAWQRKVDEITNGQLAKYSDEGRGDQIYEQGKAEGSDRSYIQGLIPPPKETSQQQLTYQPQYCAGKTDCPSFACKVFSEIKSSILFGIQSFSVGSLTRCTA